MRCIHNNILIVLDSGSYDRINDSNRRWGVGHAIDLHI